MYDFSSKLSLFKININILNVILGKDYIIEALNFHLLKAEQPGTIPNTIRTKPRQPVGLPKVSVLNIIVF